MPPTIIPTRDRELHRSVFGAACLSIQPLLLNALSLPAMALIIRRLGPTNYGQWVTATSLITAVGFVTSLGLRGKFVRSVAQDPASAQQAVAEQLGTRLALTLVAMATVLLACLALNYSPVILQCTVIASVGMAFSTGWTTLADLMQGLERFPTIASVNLAAGLLLTAASVLVILAGGGPVALSLAYLLGPLAAVVLVLGILRRQGFWARISFHPRRSWRLVCDSRHFTAQQLLAAAEANAVALMLPKLIGPAAFGIFTAGVLLSGRLTVIPESIGAALYPMISKLTAQEPRLAARRTGYAIALGLFIGLCLALIGTAFASMIAHVLMPKAAANCRMIIVITLWSLPLAGVFFAMASALLGTGADRAVTRASILAAIVSLPVGIFLVIRFGALGACGFILARFAIRICVLLPEFFRVLVVPFSRRGQGAEREAALDIVNAMGCQDSPAVTPVLS